jgi:peptidoglycan/xylan/chitin deacetylase (PgdA/CDA1 family)
MPLARIAARFYSRQTRLCADRLFRRRIRLNLPRPLISFTFDDFPRTALFVAGSILQRFELRATYYVSLGLAGKEEASGAMFELEDLNSLREAGHELGCHTFDHCDSGSTNPRLFTASVQANARRLEDLFPGERFRSFSFPKSAPRPWTKQAVSKRFDCCRGGGQQANTGWTDLNYLRAFFLEQAAGDMQRIKRAIYCNMQTNGWLIFATHDICRSPSAYGCTPSLFTSAVRYAIDSGALILPVAEALDKVQKCSIV